MRPEQTDYCIILLFLGIAVSVVGTLDYTGVADIFLPGQTVFVGYAAIIAGIILFYKDRRDNASAIEDYVYDASLMEMMASVPDDGYVLDLTSPDGRAPDAHMPPICDLTVGRDDVPDRIFFGTEIDVAGNRMETAPPDPSAEEAGKRGGPLASDMDMAGERFDDTGYSDDGEPDMAGEPLGKERIKP